MSAEDLSHAVDEYQQAINAMTRGDAGPYKKVFSHGEDVTLANPMGPPVRGWPQVEAVLERAASHFREGEQIRFESVSQVATAEMAYVVEIEHCRGKVGESEDVVSWALRSTTVFRQEDGVWKVCHRHADSITTPRPIESALGHVSQ